MKQKTFGFITLSFIIYSIILFSNNSEKIKNTEHTKILSNIGKEIPTEIIYCQSGNYYQVQGNQYIKFSKQENIIEKGNFNDVRFNAYLEFYEVMIFTSTVLIIIFYILFLYYMKQHSPFQRIKDHQIQKNKKSFLQLSKKEKKIIINENPCMKCKIAPKLKFIEETYDQKWGITQVYFHCKKCDEVVKIRR